MDHVCDCGVMLCLRFDINTEDEPVSLSLKVSDGILRTPIKGTAADELPQLPFAEEFLPVIAQVEYSGLLWRLGRSFLSVSADVLISFCVCVCVCVCVYVCTPCPQPAVGVPAPDHHLIGIGRSG